MGGGASAAVGDTATHQGLDCSSRPNTRLVDAQDFEDPVDDGVDSQTVTDPLVDAAGISPNPVNDTLAVASGSLSNAKQNCKHFVPIVMIDRRTQCRF